MATPAVANTARYQPSRRTQASRWASPSATGRRTIGSNFHRFRNGDAGPLITVSSRPASGLPMLLTYPVAMMTMPASTHHSRKRRSGRRGVPRRISPASPKPATTPVSRIGSAPVAIRKASGHHGEPPTVR